MLDRAPEGARTLVVLLLPAAAVLLLVFVLGLLVVVAVVLFVVLAESEAGALHEDALYTINGMAAKG